MQGMMTEFEKLVDYYQTTGNMLMTNNDRRLRDLGVFVNSMFMDKNFIEFLKKKIETNAQKTK